MSLLVDEVDEFMSLLVDEVYKVDEVDIQRLGQDQFLHSSSE